MLKIIILAFLVLAGQTIQTITGFGSNAVALSIGSHIFSLDSLIVVLVTLSTIQVTWLALRNYSKIQWDVLIKRIFPSCAIGMPAGMLLYYNFGVGQLKIVLGIFIVAASVSELYRLYRTKKPSGPLPVAAAFAVLITAGFIHGVFATGGPLIVYYSSRQIGEKGEFRATMAMLWVVLDWILMFSYFFAGRLTTETLTISAYCLPALVAGIFLGEVLHDRVDQNTFKKIVQIILFIAGMSLFFR